MEPLAVTPDPGPVPVPLSRCVSPAERKARLSCFLISSLVWIASLFATVAFFGIPVFLFLIRLLSEAYLVRKLRAGTVRVSAVQFPSIHQAHEACRKALGIDAEVDLFVVQAGDLNAFSLGMVRRNVVVLNSSAVEKAVQHPPQLRFLIGHELTHSALDKTFAGRFLIYRNARFKAGREATCDRAGAACAGDPEEAAAMLKRLHVGNHLFQQVSEVSLAEDADRAKSGFLGWVLRQYATYPPVGDRLRDSRAFLSELRGGR